MVKHKLNASSIYIMFACAQQSKGSADSAFLTYKLYNTINISCSKRRASMFYIFQLYLKNNTCQIYHKTVTVLTELPVILFLKLQPFRLQQKYQFWCGYFSAIISLDIADVQDYFMEIERT